jgi:hypothetical protein
MDFAETLEAIDQALAESDETLKQTTDPRQLILELRVALLSLKAAEEGLHALKVRGTRAYAEAFYGQGRAHPLYPDQGSKERDAI